MVVGVVLGCGIFIKSGAVLKACGGNLLLALLAWGIGGIIMISGAYCFAIYANRVEKFNGLVDYVEYASNKKIGYYVAYFFGAMYFPIIGSHVAIVSASYLMSACGWYTGPASWNTILTAFIIITLLFLLNYLAPWIAGKFQVSIMMVKLVPIVLIVIFGIMNISHMGEIFINNPVEGTVNSFGEAIKITSFAYDGWICATAINSEMKNSKKNLPRALTIGTFIIVGIYILFVVSLSLIIGNQAVISENVGAALVAFNKMLGAVGGTILLVFIFTSCLGNVNAMTMCSVRSFIAIAVRDQGLKPEKLKQFKNGRNSFFISGFSYVMMALFLFIWYLIFSGVPFFRHLKSMDEMVCALIYLVFVFVYIYMMRKYKDLNKFKRFVMPTIAIIGSLFFVFCGTGLFQLCFEGISESALGFACFLGMMVIICCPSIFLYKKETYKSLKEYQSSNEYLKKKNRYIRWYVFRNTYLTKKHK